MPTTKVPASRMISYDTGSFCFRNKIINGDMRIDQRNAGASVSLNLTNNQTYTLDRWQIANVTGTVQQVSDAPAGFSNSLRYTVTTARPPSAGDVSFLVQRIEGNNTVDLAWGTSAAKTITISFWVKSSLTGNFTVGSYNVSGLWPSWSVRTYLATYTINQANTWEYKTITIVGDTVQVPNLTTNQSTSIMFDLGTGSTYTTSTANQWLAGEFEKISSNVNINSTQGATFQITGVQFEVGPTATPFEYRPIGTELALCQRYYWRAANADLTGFQAVAGDSFRRWPLFFPVTMRVAPVITGTARDQVSNFVWNSIGGSEGVSRMFATAYLSVGNSTNWTILTNAAADAEL